MQKRVVILAVVFLSIAVSVNAFHERLNKFVLPNPQIENELESEGRLLYAHPLPDLVVTDIIIPDTLPLYTVVEDFGIEIKNKGNGILNGRVRLDVDILSPNLPGAQCRLRSLYAGGGLGQTDPKEASALFQIRESYLLPGQSTIVPLFIPGYDERLSRSCRRQLTEDLVIRVRVNPPDGGFTRHRDLLRGNIVESDYSNNEFEKRIKVTNRAEEISNYPLVFDRGLNAFSLPVIVPEFTAYDFVESTGCELYKLDEEDLPSSRIGRVMVDLTKIQYVDYSEQLEPGIGYFAECDFATTLSVTGKDPGELHIPLIPSGLNLLPTRIGMLGQRFMDVTTGCTYGKSDETTFYRFVSGNRNQAGKITSEVQFRSAGIVPGQLYFMLCGHSQGGTWDPEGLITQTDYSRPIVQFTAFNIDHYSQSTQLRPRSTRGGVGGLNYHYRAYYPGKRTQYNAIS
jgi:hypothetical protein